MTVAETKPPQDSHDTSEYQEIVFSLIAPIGTDLAMLYEKLKQALATVEYDTYPIHIMEHVPGYDTIVNESSNRFDLMKKKIELGTKYRERHQRSDVFAGLAVGAIQRIRSEKNVRINDVKAKLVSPLAKTAYVLKQLKRPEEVDSLRKAYGNGLYLISAYSSHKRRSEVLARVLGQGIPTKETPDLASKLIHLDEEEEGKKDFGQQLGKTFPKGDFFINMDKSEEDISNSIRRFVEIIFGVTHTPTKEEYGMFHAYGTALTSASLARQVGASIATIDGDIIADGTNEVPKPNGGLYWDDDQQKDRDCERGYDLNQRAKKIVFDEIIRALVAEELIAKESDGNLWDQIDHKALLLDRLELSRTVHAEMAALMTAVRLGESAKGFTLYTTTFPCDNCAKHIVAAGIKDVVYIEPYPKSLTTELYPDSIEIEERATNKVLFRPFIGISPRRYMDLFDMNHPMSPKERKDKAGDAIKPGHSEWKWKPRFGVDPTTIKTKETILISTFKIQGE
ncbi:MAG: cytidine deaminase [Candidatus Nitrosomirales archaeon]